MDWVSLPVHQFVFLILFTCVSQCCSMSPLCCYPDQFEAFMIGEEGGVIISSENVLKILGNGTVRVAYDALNQRIYFQEKYYSYERPRQVDDINMVDYAKNISYRIDSDGECYMMNGTEMFYNECIPGNAILLGRGSLGGTGVDMAHYMFFDQIYSHPSQITASVVHQDTGTECVPVRMTYSDSYQYDTDQYQFIMSVNVVDFKTGIADPTIFDPPENCHHVTSKKQYSTRPRFRRLSTNGIK